MKNCAKLGNTQRLRKRSLLLICVDGEVELNLVVAAFLSSLPISLSAQQSAPQPNHAGSQRSTEYYDCSSEREQTAFMQASHRKFCSEIQSNDFG